MHSIVSYFETSGPLVAGIISHEVAETCLLKNNFFRADSMVSSLLPLYRLGLWASGEDERAVASKASFAVERLRQWAEATKDRMMFVEAEITSGKY